MFQSLLLATGCCVLACLMHGAHAQDSTPKPLPTSPARIFEIGPNELVLINVAAKGRVVELLANELARTEIIRALLVEYARECVENVTQLERHCLDCMIDRCRDRMSACNIKSPPLEEVLTHDPAPIKGVQFLSMSPADVDHELREFANNARTDILNGIPEVLRTESEAIMHSEVDQSLTDLNENINTDKALQAISVHVQKLADNVHELPNIGVKVGESVGTLIINNEDKAVSVAELLARKLKSSRPFLQSIQHNGGRILDQMPEVIDTVGERVEEFKTKIGGVFSRVMGTFSRVMDMPDTHVLNGNIPGMMPNIPPMGGMPNVDPRFNRNQQVPFDPQFPAGPGGPPFIPGMAPSGIPTNGGQRPSFIQNVLQGGQELLSRGKELISNAIQGAVPTPLPGQPQFQGQGQGSQSQLMQPGPNQPVQFIGQTNGQFPNVQFQNNQIMSGQQQQQQFQQQQIQQQQQLQQQLQQQQLQLQQQLMQGQPRQDMQFANSIPQQPQFNNNQGKKKRRKRYDEPACDKLQLDPDMYCRKYEPQCHNCTLEKRLRFEVCGDGVEKARDEIKRMDDSMKGYLQVYNEHIAKSQLILKLETNDSTRLHKTNSHYDSFITAKIGPSIFRYKTKMILDVKNVRITGVQLGDELWEKLWENGILKEAPTLATPLTEEHVMGQNLITEIHDSHAHAQTGGCDRLPFFTSLVVSFVSFLMVAIF